MTDHPEPVGYKDKFTHGTVLDSQQGSGFVVIGNPALGQRIILDMHDKFHPVRTSESGDVERAGFDIQNGAVVRANEVWVDFNSRVAGREEGDFYRPLRTLTAAQDRVAAGGTIKIVPGSRNESIVLSKRMTIKSFPGTALIGRQ